MASVSYQIRLFTRSDVFLVAFNDPANLQWSQAINKPGSAVFDVDTADDRSTMTNLQAFNRVEIWRRSLVSGSPRSTLVWRGYVEAVNVKKDTYSVVCQEMLNLFERRRTGAAKSYAGTNGGAAVLDLLSDANGLQATGVTAGTNEITANINADAKRETVLAAWLKIIKAISTSVLIDSSGNGNHVTPILSPTLAAGLLGSALVGNGTTQYGTFPEIALSAEFTIAIWANINNGVTTDAMLLGHNLDDTKIGIMTSAMFIRVVNAGSSDNTIPMPTTNAWHFFVLRRNTANVVDLSIDGAAAVTLFAGAAQAGYMKINRLLKTGIGQFFPGKIDETKIYSRYLSDSDVVTQYNAGAGKYGFIESSLTALWHFDEFVAGAEIEIVPSYPAGVLAQVLNIRAQIGTYKTDTVVFRWIEGKAEITNLIDWNVIIDGKDMANSVYAKSTAGGTAEQNEADTVSKSTYGLLEDYEQVNDKTNNTDIDAVAANSLQQHKTPLLIPKINPDTEQVDTEAYDIGDTVRVIITRGLVDLDQNHRILTKQIRMGDNGDELVTVQLAEIGKRNTVENNISELQALGQKVSELQRSN